MTSYEIHGFEFIEGSVVFENDERTKWRVRVPEGGCLDTGFGPDLITALGANVDRVVGRLICRFKDGRPALAALYLDAGGELHWTDPVAAVEGQT